MCGSRRTHQWKNDYNHPGLLLLLSEVEEEVLGSSDAEVTPTKESNRSMSSIDYTTGFCSKKKLLMNASTNSHSHSRINPTSSAANSLLY